MKRLHGSIIFFIFSLFLLTGQQAWAGYELVADFATDGVVRTDVLGNDDRATSMVVQDDGRIIVVGSAGNGVDSDIMVLRYTRKGVLDTTFNLDGKATFAVGRGDDFGYGVVVLKDGSIIVSGTSQNSDGLDDLVLLKVTAEGIMDNDFGVGGIATFHIDDASTMGHGLALKTVAEEDRLFVAGMMTAEETAKGLVVSYSLDGDMLNDFGGGGFVTLDSPENTGVYDLAVTDEGKLLLAGYAEKNDGVKRAALFSLNADGTVDTGFGVAGAAMVENHKGDSVFYGLAVLDSGAVIGAGYLKENEKKNMFAAKYRASGTLVENFGDDGVVVHDLGDDSVAYAATEKEDSSLILAGEFQNYDNLDVALLHLDNLGKEKQNSTFASPATFADGESITDFNDSDDSARTLVLVQKDSDEIYVAGYTDDGNDSDVILMAYSIDGVSLDASSADYGSGYDGNPAFFVGTLSVTGIQRTSAISGGVITKNNSYKCKDNPGSFDPPITSSPRICPTVKERGVVYSITPYPSYRGEEETTETTGSTGTSSETDSGKNGVFPDWISQKPGYDFIRYGRTSDGSGVGTFGSDLYELSPDTTYYVRAYAVLSDGTVLYGNQIGFETSDACFIATAAYGSFLAPHVTLLRTFRDRYLKTNAVGQYFVHLYYHVSPGIAEKISESPVAQFMVRIMLLPFVAFSYFMVTFSLSSKIITVLLCGLFFLFSKHILARSKT